MSAVRLLLFASTSLAHPAFSQAVDSTRSRTVVGGAITVTNKGISTIPSFTLGKPAAIFDVSIARGRLSFEPQFKYGLDGKPWAFLFWGRYKLLDGEKIHLTIGGHPALNFITATVTENGTQKEVIVARRYVTGELYPFYSVSKTLSVGAYYLYGYGVEKDITKHTHFLALRTTLTRSLSDRYFLRFVPQVYYLRAGDRDGFYLNSTLSVGKQDLPFSFGSIVNRTIQTRLLEGEDFIWNVSVTYSIK